MKVFSSKRILLMILISSIIIKVMNFGLKKQQENYKKLPNANSPMSVEAKQSTRAIDNNMQIAQYQNHILRKIMEKKILLDNLMKNSKVNNGLGNANNFNLRKHNTNGLNNPIAMQMQVQTNEENEEKNFLNDFTRIINYEIEKKLDKAKTDITEEIRANLKTIFSINKGVLEKVEDLGKKKNDLLKMFEKQQEKNIDQSFIEDNLEEEIENKLKQNINSLNKAFEGTEKIKFTKKKSIEENKTDSLNSDLNKSNKTDLFENEYESLNLNDYSLDKLLKPM